MRSFTKQFNTHIHKEIVIVKNEQTQKYDVRMFFKVSNQITLFEGSCKVFQVNHESGHKSSQFLSFYAELSPNKIRIIIKGVCQIRTIVENDEIQKYVLERIGTCLL